ncbi:hypothetical protein WJX81_002327 [Elliptochloris bilobata]|uniref:Uncharacterized protein n=1 Tax=Elliptochloris bilobata TaxID=381761 RepID=A0AAW1QJC5_9CHLO
MMQSEPSNARQVLGAFAAAALLVAGPAAAAKPSVNSYQAAKAEEAEFERIIKERSGGKLPTISLRSPAERKETKAEKAAEASPPAATTFERPTHAGANPFSFFGGVKDAVKGKVEDAVKDKVEDAVPSGAASSLKEAMSSAKDALPGSAADAAGAAVGAVKENPVSGFFGAAKEKVEDAVPSDAASGVKEALSSAQSAEVATDGTDMVESGGEAGVPKLPPPPPEPTAAQADKVAVQESAETAPLALPSNEAPPAPQNSSGGLFSGIFSGAIPCKWAKNVGDSVKEVATDGTDMVESGGEAGVPKLPPPPPEPTAAQADKVAVPESAGTAPLALPSNEAPPAPQNSSGGLFSGIFSGAIPCKCASDAKVAAGDAAAGVVGAAKAQAPEGLIESVKDAGASVSKAAEKAVPAADDFFSGILSPGEPSDL